MQNNNISYKTYPMYQVTVLNIFLTLVYTLLPNILGNFCTKCSFFAFLSPLSTIPLSPINYQSPRGEGPSPPDTWLVWNWDIWIITCSITRLYIYSFTLGNMLGGCLITVLLQVRKCYYLLDMVGILGVLKQFYFRKEMLMHNYFKTTQCGLCII